MPSNSKPGSSFSPSTSPVIPWMAHERCRRTDRNYPGYHQELAGRQMRAHLADHVFDRLEKPLGGPRGGHDDVEPVQPRLTLEQAKERHTAFALYLHSDLLELLNDGSHNIPS